MTTAAPARMEIQKFDASAVQYWQVKMRWDKPDGPGTNKAVPGGHSRATPDAVIYAAAGLAGSQTGAKAKG